MKINPLHSRPYLSCVLQGSISTKGLYDTGADITCMSKEAFRRIPIANRPVKLLTNKDRKISSASTDPLVSLGLYEMTISVLGKEVKQKVVVLNKLSEDFIIGMDMISHHKIYFDPVEREFHWDRPQEWSKGHVKTRKMVKLAPLSVTTIPVQLSTESGLIPDATHTAMVNIGHHQNPYLTGGPYMITADNQGNTWLPVYTCSPVEVELPRGDFIGLTENL